MVVDDGGDATVWIDLQIFRILLFFLAEIEVHRLIRQPEFFKDDGDFPKNQIDFQDGREASEERVRDLPAVNTSFVGVQSKLLSVGHRRLVVTVLEMVFGE